MLFRKNISTSQNIKRFFTMFVLVILMAITAVIWNTFNTWINYQNSVMRDTANAFHKRIESYQLIATQLYKYAATDNIDPGIDWQPAVKRLRPDIYYFDKNNNRINTLIFGSHDKYTLFLAQSVSDYLNVLWGANTNVWSMYLLNGRDSSFTMISTLPLNELVGHNRDSLISTLANQRQNEILLQANQLSGQNHVTSLRFLNWQNHAYFTLVTTVNKPNQEADSIAFDLPVKDIIPKSLIVKNFQLKTVSHVYPADKTDVLPSTKIALIAPNLEFTTTLPNQSLQLIYQQPLAELVTLFLSQLFWPLVACLLLFLLALSVFLLLRKYLLCPEENKSNELHTLRILNEEIVNNLPIGLLIYNFTSKKIKLINKIAENLLPELNINKIANMFDHHSSRLQITINNQAYEIRQIPSLLSPHTKLFIIRDQDQELLVSQKLKQAQKILQRNQLMRQTLLQNLAQCIAHPLESMHTHLMTLSEIETNDIITQLIESSRSLITQLDEIVLLNRVEADDLPIKQKEFCVQVSLEKTLVTILPLFKRKGLLLTVNNHLHNEEVRYGDSWIFGKILELITHYALISTSIGKISFDINCHAQNPDRLVLTVSDTGRGLSSDELANVHFPFLGSTTQDRFGSASSLALFLCKKLSEKIKGELTITSQLDIGTHYRVELPLPICSASIKQDKLLDGLTFLVNIGEESRREIVCRQLSYWGAEYLFADDKLDEREHDFLITDAADKCTGWAILVTDDEAGYQAIGPQQYRVNVNLINMLQKALLALIEQRLAASQPNRIEHDILSLSTMGDSYYSLFVETVPEDVERLHKAFNAGDYSALSQTAHRLKGVFAILNIDNGRELCEILEHNIKMDKEHDIRNGIYEIDAYLNQLLKQGNKNE